MSAITQCPACNTRFKASQSQLEAHQGMVRCGHCQATFNAMQNLYDEQPSPQLSLLMDAEELENINVAATAIAEESSGQTSSPLTLTQQFAVLKSVNAASKVTAMTELYWLWLLGAIFLAVVLLAQASYFFRVDIAARLPGLKPALTLYCAWLKCTIPLPKNADLISIESSDLEASPTQSSIVDLNVILRNRAPYTQAYPNLELTLTDITDQVLARRNFLPAEYLKADEDKKLGADEKPGEEKKQSDDEKQGLSAGREISIKLHLDTTDLQPTGYRLFLFYPNIKHNRAPLDKAGRG